MRGKKRPIRSSVPKWLPAVLVLATPLLASRPGRALAAGTDLAATQPADAVAVKALARGTVRFNPPDGWDEIPANATDVRAVYFLHDRASALSVEILPADAQIGPESSGPIIRRLRQMRQQNKETFVEGPTSEKDARFLLRIHEKYHTIVKVDDKPTKKVAIQLHLYRQVGPRIMLVTVWSSADSEDEIKRACAAGENVALSAKFGKAK